MTEIVRGFTVIFAVAKAAGSAILVAVTAMDCGEATEVGAEYNPLGEMVPTSGLIDHTTDEFVVPVNVAKNCCVVEVKMEAGAVGDTEVVTGTSLNAVVAVFVLSAELIAMTVTVCAEATMAGAVYVPLDKVPTDGDMDQVTLTLLDPVTVA